MKSALVVLLVLACLAPVRADEIAREANGVAVLYALDAVSTRTSQSRWTYEFNPIARPFVKSDGGTILYFATSALVTNGLARLIGRRSKPAARTFLAAQAAFEVTMLVHNAHVDTTPPCVVQSYGNGCHKFADP